MLQVFRPNLRCFRSRNLADCKHHVASLCQRPDLAACAVAKSVLSHLPTVVAGLRPKLRGLEETARCPANLADLKFLGWEILILATAKPTGFGSPYPDGNVGSRLFRTADACKTAAKYLGPGLWEGLGITLDLVRLTSEVFVLEGMRGAWAC